MDVQEMSSSMGCAGPETSRACRDYFRIARRAARVQMARSASTVRGKGNVSLIHVGLPGGRRGELFQRPDPAAGRQLNPRP